MRNPWKKISIWMGERRVTKAEYINDKALRKADATQQKLIKARRRNMAHLEDGDFGQALIQDRTIQSREETDKEKHDLILQHLLTETPRYSEEIGVEIDDEKFPEHAFEHLSLEIVKKLIFRSSSVPIDGRVCGGVNDEEVDAWILQKDPDESGYGLTLIQAKWHYLDEPDDKFPTDNDQPVKLMKIAADSINDGTDVGNRGYKDAQTEWREWQEKIAEDDEHTPQIRLVMVCPRMADGDTQTYTDKWNVTWVELDEICNWIDQPAIAALPVTNKIIKADLHNIGKDYIGSMTGFEVARMFSKPPEGEHRERDMGLLELNVRLRLSREEGKKLDESSKRADVILRRTRKSIENKSIKFFGMNNGLTITTTKITLIEKGSGTYKLKLPQIVNGGQTINAIYDYYKNGEDELLKGLNIPVKIVVCDHDNYQKESSEVAGAANSQNPVEARDLKARDDGMKQLQKRFNNLTWNVFFDVRKGEWDEFTSSGRAYMLDNNDVLVLTETSKFGKLPVRYIDNYKFGQYIWATVGGGYSASKQKVKLFDEFSLFSSVYWPNQNFPLNTLLIDEAKIFYANETIDDIVLEGHVAELFANCFLTLGGWVRSKKKIYSALGERQKMINSEKLNLYFSPHLQLTLLNQAFRVRFEQLGKNNTEGRRELCEYLLGGDKPYSGRERPVKRPEFAKRPFISIPSRKEKIKELKDIDSDNCRILLKKLGGSAPDDYLKENDYWYWIEYVQRIAMRVFSDMLANNPDVTDVRSVTTGKTIVAKTFVDQCIELFEADKEHKFLPLGDQFDTPELTNWNDTLTALKIMIERKLP